MAYNFKEMREEVLGFAKTFALDDPYWVGVANSSINNALRTLQHKITDFNALETKDNTVVYPANSVTLDLKDSNIQDVNKIISVNRLFSPSDHTGKPLLVMDYTSLQQNMLRFEQKRTPVSFENEEFNSYASYITQVQGFIVYLIGTDLGLYPMPTQDINLAVHYTKYLPDLVNDTDTNVLLENCSEYIFYFSLRRLNVLLSEGDRISISSNLLQEALQDARAWNSSLVHSNPIEL